MLFDQAIDIPEVLSSGEVMVSLMPEKIRVNLRARASDRAKIAKACGLKLPTQVSTAATGKKTLTACLGPEEWMIIADRSDHPELVERMMIVAETHMMSVTDISHRNVGFSVSGPGAATLINVGCPLDLGLDAFPVGKLCRTIFENAPITLYRVSEDTFEVECWRSLGPYLRDYFVRVRTVL